MIVYFIISLIFVILVDYWSYFKICIYLEVENIYFLICLKNSKINCGSCLKETPTNIPINPPIPAKHISALNLLPFSIT